MNNERRLSSLSDLANVDIEEEVVTTENSEITTSEGDDVGTNENLNVTTNGDNDYEPTLLKKVASKKSVKFEKTQVSIYLDDDVYKKYMRFGKKYGRGARSELVNELLRRELKDY